MHNMSNNLGEEFVYEPAKTVPDVARVIIPGTTEEIPTDAFRHHHAFQEVVLKEGVIEIGENAFICCDALKHVDLPSTLVRIGKLAFGGTYFIEGIESSREHHIFGSFFIRQMLSSQRSDFSKRNSNYQEWRLQVLQVSGKCCPPFHHKHNWPSRICSLQVTEDGAVDWEHPNHPARSIPSVQFIGAHQCSLQISSHHLEGRT